MGLQLERCMQKELDSEAKQKYEIVKVFFFFEKDIAYTAPGLKDYVTVYEGGKKRQLQKHYLNMFLREAFSVFKARYPEISISFTAFCKLRPKNVLLLKNTPMDQC